MRPITQEDIKVLGRIVSISTEGVVADALQIWDSEWPLDVAGNEKGWDQQDINKYFRDYIAAILRGDHPFDRLKVVGNLEVGGTIDAPTIITSKIQSRNNSGLTFEGNIGITGNLNVAHTITGNELNITGDANIGRNLTVDGTSTFNSKVTINNGGIDVHGNSKFFDNVTFDKNVNITKNLTVGGHTTLNTVDATSINTSNLTIGGQSIDQYITNAINNNADLASILGRLTALETWKNQMQIWKAKIDACYERMCTQNPSATTYTITYVGDNFTPYTLVGGVSTTTVAEGDSAEIDIVPDNGYRITNVVISGQYVEKQDTHVLGGNNNRQKFTLVGITSDIVITVTTAQIPTHTLTWKFNGQTNLKSNTAFTHSLAGNASSDTEDVYTFNSGASFYDIQVNFNQEYASQNNVYMWSVRSKVGAGSWVNHPVNQQGTGLVSPITLIDVDADVIIEVETIGQPVEPEPDVPSTLYEITKIVNLDGQQYSTDLARQADDATNNYSVQKPSGQQWDFVSCTVSPQSGEVTINGETATVTNPSQNYTITWNYTTAVVPSNPDRTITQVIYIDNVAGQPITSQLASNASAEFTQTPSGNVTFDSVSVSPSGSNEVTINGSTVTITNPSQNYTINWYYNTVQATTYTVTLNLGNSGASASDNTVTTTVQEGGSYTNTITAPTNKVIYVTATPQGGSATTIGNGVASCNVNLTNIQTNYTISVTAEDLTYDLLLLPNGSFTDAINSQLGTITLPGASEPVTMTAIGGGSNSGIRATLPVSTRSFIWTPSTGAPFVYDYSFTGATNQDGNHDDSSNVVNGNNITFNLTDAEVKDSSKTFSIVLKENIKLNGQDSLTVNITPTSLETGDITVTNIQGNVILKPTGSDIVTKDLNGTVLTGAGSNGVDDFYVTGTDGNAAYAYNLKGQAIHNPFKVSVAERYLIYKNNPSLNTDIINKIKAGYQVIIPIGDRYVQKYLTVRISGFDNYFDA